MQANQTHAFRSLKNTDCKVNFNTKILENSTAYDEALPQTPLYTAYRATERHADKI